MRRQLEAKIASFPRQSLAHLPTPLEEAKALATQLGPYHLLLKRDDATGLALGGNKTRKLEFIMGDVLAQGADSVVTWGATQSNWCRQTAAAAAKLGLHASLVLLDRGGAGRGVDGNLLLDRLFGASIQYVSVDPSVQTLELEGVSEHVERAAQEERERGRRPYIAPIGGSLLEGSMREPWGAIGYVDAFLELLSQVSALGKPLDAVVHATGSGSTQAGLLAGALACSPKTRIVGISVSEGRETMAGYVRKIADSTLELLGLDLRTREEDVIVLDDYLEAGYGMFTPAVGAALERMARAEGVLLDPVYTGKALVGLLDLLAQGFFEENETIVFLHSGGTPALFPYREAIANHLG